MTSRRLGFALTVGGAVLFSTKAIFVKLAYFYPVSSIALLGLRMGFSLPAFLLVGYLRRERRAGEEPLTGKTVALVAGLGLMGYYGASYTDFLGLRYLTAGMERIVLFVYPTLVLLIQRALFGTRITRVQAFATAVCYAGLVVAFGAADLRAGSDFLVGAALVFASALLYAGFVIGNGRLTPRFGSVRFTSIAMTAAACGVLAHGLLAGERFVGLAPAVYAYGATIALVCTVVPSYMLAEGIRRIGASDAAIVGAVGPLVTIGLEYVVLGETLTWGQGVGGALVVAGVLAVARTRQGASRRSAPRRSPR